MTFDARTLMRNKNGVMTGEVKLKSLKKMVVVCAVLMLAACTSEQARRDNRMVISRSSSGNLFVKVQSETYVIKQGDNVEFSVWGYPEFNTSTTVKPGGMILIPLVGEVKAAGFSKDEFSSQVKTRMSEYVQGDVRISLAVSSPLTQKVSVIGSVTRQDNYPVTSEVSLMEILSTAGGTMADSDLNHVRIIRLGSNSDPVEVDVAYHLESGEVDLMPKVRPGDTVFVPKKENFIRSFSDFLRDVVLLFGFFRVFN